MRYKAECVNENWLIYTRADELLVDEVVRFENFKSDLTRISPRLGLDHNIFDDMKTIHAKGDFRPEKKGEKKKPAAIIGPNERAHHRAPCAREIEAFGYDYPAFAGLLSATPPAAEPLVGAGMGE